MKPSSFSLLFAALILHAGLSLPALADTVTLKDGKVLEGTIIKETDDHVTIAVKLKGITDEIRVKRADITKMVKDKKKAAPPQAPAGAVTV